MTATDLVTDRDLAVAIDARGEAHDAAFLQGFVQTGPGGYGEGDRLVGEWLLGPPSHDVAATLDPLADSPSLWHRRVVMLATLAFTRAGDPRPALSYATEHLDAEERARYRAMR